MKAKILVYALPALSLTTIRLAEAQLTKITVGYPVISVASLPAGIAKESGIFRNNGLDVQLVYFRGGTTAVLALLSRECPITLVAGPAIVSASLRGAHAVMI